MKVKLNYGDGVITDPCYIKSVSFADELRFDALKHVKTIHDGSDGLIRVGLADKTVDVGCDSGRVWLMVAEFGCEVEIESGLSGHIILDKDDPNLYNDIEAVDE